MSEVDKLKDQIKLLVEELCGRVDCYCMISGDPPCKPCRRLNERLKEIGVIE